MISYLAVVFFCLNGDCYFYNGAKLHDNVAACVKEVQSVEAELAKQKIKTNAQCLKIPLGEA